MKKLSFTLLVVLIFLCQLQLKAQSGNTEGHRKAVFAEAFGQDLHAGVHYDMRLLKGRQGGPGFRMGVSGTVAGVDHDGTDAMPHGVLAFPLGINYLAGEKRSSFEAGLGIMPMHARTDLLSPTKPKIINQNGWSIPVFMNFGYRFQPVSNGFIFRLTCTPVISSAGFFPDRFGVSAGYSFQ